MFSIEVFVTNNLCTMVEQSLDNNWWTVLHNAQNCTWTIVYNVVKDVVLEFLRSDIKRHRLRATWESFSTYLQPPIGFPTGCWPQLRILCWLGISRWGRLRAALMKWYLRSTLLPIESQSLHGKNVMTSRNHHQATQTLGGKMLFS